MNDKNRVFPPYKKKIFQLIFNSKPIYLFRSMQNRIMISLLAYNAYLITFMNIYRIKTYPYEDALQANKMSYQSSLNND